MIRWISSVFEEIMKIKPLGKIKLWFSVSKIKMQFLEFRKSGNSAPNN